MCPEIEHTTKKTWSHHYWYRKFNFWSTPNMHMHAHLKSCTDYGPLHGFWVYVFEHYNGSILTITGVLNHNGVFCNILAVSHEYPDKFADEFLSHFSSLRGNSSQQLVGSLADTFSSSPVSSCSRECKVTKMSIKAYS